MPKTFQEEAVFELKFWLQVLADHSRFIHDSLAVSEVSYLTQANSFIKQFESLVNDVQNEMTESALLQILKTAKTASESIRVFKLKLIEEHLVGTIIISLPPTFINHMVNEVDEAIRLLSFLEKGQTPPAVHPIHHDLLWLLDAAGHAGAIESNLDQVEKNLKKKAERFTKDWEGFYLKSIELAGYLRTNVMEFPALERFHNDVYLEMTIFKTFLKELEEMRFTKEALGTLSPLMADHMAREECYYLLKLAETTNVPEPSCDPTVARRE